MKIKKDDTVLVITGKDKGKQGKVLQTFPKNTQILVAQVNLKKKHQKPKKQGEKGQVVQMPGLISVSNVKLICSKCEKAVKVGYKTEGEKKYRMCKKCKENL
jgi:large subunit ribosomal protein L24